MDKLPIKTGRANRFATRFNNFDENKDFYPTPRIATEKLLEREVFEGDIWEPACGDGAISKVLEEKGMTVFSSDLVYRGYGEQADFLSISKLTASSNIITNPPYKIAEEFLNQALIMADRKIAFLLRLTFLESEGRYNLLTQSPLKTVYVFSKRLPIYKNGIVGNSGMVAYAWYVWEKGYEGKPIIEWIL